MFNQDQIQVKSKHLHQNVPQCPIPIWTCWSGICAYDHSESDNWNTGVQRGIQHDWSQQVWSKYQQLSFWETYLYHRDGFIDNEDLHDMLASLGKVQSNKQSMCKIIIFLCQHWSLWSNCFRTQPTNTWKVWWARHPAQSTSPCSSPSLERGFRSLPPFPPWSIPFPTWWVSTFLPGNRSWGDHQECFWLFWPGECGIDSRGALIAAQCHP